MMILLNVRKIVGLPLILLVFHLAVNAQTRILLLNSYHSTYSWSQDIEKAVKNNLCKNNTTELATEYLDLKRFITDSIQNEICSLLEKKYKSAHFNLVICADDPAFHFFLTFGNRLNLTCPVIACGVSEINNYPKDDRFYYIGESDFFDERIKAKLAIFPNAENLYFIIDQTPNWGEYKKRNLKLFEKYKNKYHIHFIEKHNTIDISGCLKQIKPNSIVEYVAIDFDSTGRSVDTGTAGAQITKSANFPIFTGNYYLIGKGAIGGYVYSGKVQGEEAAKIALQVLNSEKNIPHLVFPKGIYIYDYAILKKFHITLTSLPKGCTIINLPHTIFSDYRNELIIIILVLVLLLIIILILLFNIRLRKKAEHQLHESEQRFREIAELLPQTIYETDTQGKFLFVNKQGIEMFGYSEEDLKKGKTIYDMVIPEEAEHVKANINSIIRGNKHDDNVFIARRKDGTTFPFQVHSNVVYKDKKPIGMRGIGIDISQQKRIENELIAAKLKAEESDKLKSAFLSNMSHEIRTPLNSIIGFSNLLLDDSLEKEVKEEYQNYIQRSSEYLLNLVNDILDFSKIESGQLTINKCFFNLNELINELHAHFTKEKNKNGKQSVSLLCNNKEASEDIYFYSDPLRIKQILSNFIDNALKFTDKGYVQFGFSIEKENEILFTITDTGVGINDDDKPFIFKRFYKLNSGKGKLYPGSGLGLSICKHLIKHLGGNIGFLSEKDKGSQFYFTVPGEIKLRSKQAESVISQNTANTYNWKEFTILIAEDERMNFYFLQAILSKTGIHIIHAQNGIEAIELIKNQPVDLVLMDIQMPLMNGNEAIVEIKKNHPHLPVIAQTAHAMVGDRESILNSGFDNYISKPIDKTRLFELISSYLS